MWWSILGIVLVLIGTTFSLWSIITNDTKKEASWAGVKERGIDAKKEKTKVIIGILLIFVGSVFQIIGTVISCNQHPCSCSIILLRAMPH